MYDAHSITLLTKPDGLPVRSSWSIAYEGQPSAQPLPLIYAQVEFRPHP